MSDVRKDHKSGTIADMIRSLVAEGEDVVLLGAYNSRVSLDGNEVELSALLLLNKGREEFVEVLIMPDRSARTNMIPLDLVRDMPAELLELAAVVTGSSTGQAIASMWPLYLTTVDAPIGANAIEYDHCMMLRIFVPGMDMQDIWYASTHHICCFPSMLNGRLPKYAEAKLSVEDFQDFASMEDPDAQAVYAALTSEEGLSVGRKFNLKICPVMLCGYEAEADPNKADVN